MRHELAALPSSVRVEKINTRVLRETLRSRVDQWRAMSRDNVAEGRRLLHSLIEERIVFTPAPRPPHIPPRKGPGRKSPLIYEFKGYTTLSRVFADLISASGLVAPTGFEPVFQP